MTSWPDARALAHSAATALPAVELPLAEAGGCVLAAALAALASVPTYDGSAMDGWAVRGPGPWRVVGRVLAGDPLPGLLEPGTAVEVATGAPLPTGHEGVIPCEQGTLEAELTGPHPAGRHVRLRGEECLAGEVILPAGTVLSAAALGLAAAIGYDVVPVHPRPRVLALVTGSEVVKAGLPGPDRSGTRSGRCWPPTSRRPAGSWWASSTCTTTSTCCAR